MKRVLVVDDQSAFRDLIADVLIRDGFQVETASNGVEALAQMREDRPDAVLLDIRMPLMDGWSVLRTCQRDPLYAAIPIAVMSDSREAQAAVTHLGARAFVHKAFQPRALLDTMHTLTHTVGPAGPPRTLVA